MRLSTVSAQLLLPLTIFIDPSAADYRSANAKTMNEPRKVLLSQIKRLTFERGNYYMGRRSSGPQLKNVGGNAAGYYEPQVVQCKNLGPGYDVQDVQWSCTATMPKYYRFGKTDVICEGFADKEDPFVTRGSCGLEYTLHLTEEGEKAYKYSKLQPRGFWPKGSVSYFDIFTRVAIVVIGLVILYSFVRRLSGTRPISHALRRTRRFFFGGSGVDGHDDGNGGGGGGWGSGFGSRGPPPAYNDDPRGFNKPSGLSGISPLTSGMIGAAAGYGISQFLNRDNGEGSSRGSTRSPPMGMRDAHVSHGFVSPPGSGTSMHGSSMASNAPHFADAAVPMHRSTGFGTTKRRDS